MVCTGAKRYEERPLPPQPLPDKELSIQNREGDSINVLKHIVDAKYFAEELKSRSANFGLKTFGLILLNYIPLYSPPPLPPVKPKGLH